MTIQAQTATTWPPHKFVRPHEDSPSRTGCLKCGKVLAHVSHVGIEEEHEFTRSEPVEEVDRQVLASAFEMVHLHSTRLLMALEIVADNVYKIDRIPVDKTTDMVKSIRESHDRLRESYETGRRAPSV